MRRTFYLIIGLVMLFGITVTVYAAPMYYVFQGTGDLDDPLGIVASTLSNYPVDTVSWLA